SGWPRTSTCPHTLADAVTKGISMNVSILRRVGAIAALACFAACGERAPTVEEVEASAPAAEVGTARAYDWFMESTPAGRTLIVSTGDGRVTNESFIHWNNREYELDSELQLDAAGMVVAQRITGTSPFGAAIDEQFSWQDGLASWRTVGEKGSAQTDAPAFYVPVEFGAVESLAALVRAGLQSIDGEVALLPSGTARVEKLRGLSVDTPQGAEELALYGVSGIRFT